MKITPNSSLFTAISNFPDAGQVRDGLADRRKLKNAGGDGAAIPGGEARDVVRREALKKAALLQNQHAATDAKSPTPAAKTMKATAPAAAPAEDAAATYNAGSVRREAPFAESKPKFVRLGQFIDIKV
ncbi:MAG: hypothetical protein DCC73_08615 [Proteobacteria bacterium]|nr:MAG: hypothetical protein DCC73_08615 [Pseudomonadota bacterium]